MHRSKQVRIEEGPPTLMPIALLGKKIDQMAQKTLKRKKMQKAKSSQKIYNIFIFIFWTTYIEEPIFATLDVLLL
jgi:hypothetical protein